MKKQIEWLLFRSGISNYRISQATGITQVVLSKYATGKSDVGRMTLDNAERLYKFYEEVIAMAEEKYGTIDFEGKKYTLLGNADFTNRVLDSRYTNYHEASEGEAYDVEFSAPGVDPEGNAVTVYWMFQFVKGSEPEDLSNLDWEMPSRVEVV